MPSIDGRPYVICPESISNIFAITLSNVDFPLPFSPRMMICSPLFTYKLALSKIFLLPSVNSTFCMAITVLVGTLIKTLWQSFSLLSLYPNSFNAAFSLETISIIDKYSPPKSLKLNIE